MLYRDDLYQANRRVTELEAQLIEARANRDQLAGDVPVEKPAPRTTVSRDIPEAYEWWPVLVMMLGTILYFAYFRVRLDEFDLPLEYVIPSAIFGSAIYAGDVVMRYFNGNRRTVLCRLLIVLGAIVGGPALVMAFLAFGGIMGFVGPIIGIIVVVGSVIFWIVGGD